MDENNGIKKVKITVNGDNDNLNKQIVKFWTSLMESNESFVQRLKKEENEWNEVKSKFKDNKSYYFIPEKIKNKSPITFFNGAWGTGKSYFFQKLVELWAQDSPVLSNIKSDFKNIVIIDLWDYINNDNMIDLILNDCYDLIFTKEKKFWKKIKSWIKNIDTSKITMSWSMKVLLFITKCIIGVSKQELSEKEIEDNTIPTILIFENIERLEDRAVEVIKLMQKLSVLKNLIIIFPLAKSKICSLGTSVDNNSNTNEHWLNKYATLGVEYEFSQDFIPFIQSAKINGDDEYVQKENEELVNQIFVDSGLNLREVETRVNYSNNKELIQELFKMTKYHACYYIEKEVVNAKTSKKVNWINKDLKNVKNFFDKWMITNFNSEPINLEFYKIQKLVNSPYYLVVFRNEEFRFFLDFFNFKNYPRTRLETLSLIKTLEENLEKMVTNSTLEKEVFIMFHYLSVENFTNLIKKNIKGVLEYIIKCRKLNRTLNIEDEVNLFINEINTLLNELPKEEVFFIQLLTILKMIVSQFNENISKATIELDDFKRKSGIGWKEFNFLSQRINIDFSYSNFLKEIEKDVEADIKQQVETISNFYDN